MIGYEAPGKVNLSLLVYPPGANGYHPLESLVQTVGWCDTLEVAHGEGRDELESEIEDNLIHKALDRLRSVGEVPPLRMALTKTIPVAAGLGGGSSDAAAALVAGADVAGISRARLPDVAYHVGADVSLFLTGGTVMMSGLGDVIGPVERAEGFAIGVVVPGFGLSTKEVYDQWDVMEGPEGAAVDDGRLPPSLRDRMPMRNDLLPAAIDLEPRLGDFMADVRAVWDTTVCLTGSGSACFGYFATRDEAVSAVDAVSDLTSHGRGVGLRGHGVSRIEEPNDAT